MSDPDSLSHLLPRVLDQLKDSGKKRVYWDKVDWGKIAGKLLGKKTRVLGIKGSTLVLSTDHPAWAQQVNEKTATLICAWNKEFPENKIKDIRIRLGET